MSNGTPQDQQPAFLFASWTFFLVVSAQLVVKGPGYLSAAAVAGWERFAGEGEVPRWVATAVERASGWLLVALCAIGFVGYLLRFLPPPAAGRAWPTYLQALLGAALTAAAFPFAAWVWEGVWREGLWKGCFAGIGWLLYVGWNVRRRATLDRPFVLFLRRFNSFADLALLRAILRLTPAGAPVVLLAGGEDWEEGMWDPRTLVALGFRAVIPGAGRPLLLDGGENWKRVVESLIERCAVVVVDTTERSPAVDFEMETIARLGRTGSVVEISDGGESAADSPPSAAPAPLARLEYRRSAWSLVVPVGLVVSVCLVVARYADLAGQISAAAEEGELVGALFGAAVMMGLLASLLGFLTVRRGLTRRSLAAVRAALRSGLQRGNR